MDELEPLRRLRDQAEIERTQEAWAPFIAMLMRLPDYPKPSPDAEAMFREIADFIHEMRDKVEPAGSRLELDRAVEIIKTKLARWE